ncbi:MAG: hypothetical protein NUV94_07730 [Candidatus Acetothermia bacterium]|nr:hypothetical protein [Candidatus Acetothermia bacterium]
MTRYARFLVAGCILIGMPLLCATGCSWDELFVPQELLQNGSFSEGGVNWGVVGDFWVGANPSSFPDYRTQPGYAMGGVDLSGRPKNTAEGMLYQVITIPGGATRLTVSFWHNITSEEPRDTAPLDRMLIVLVDATGTEIVGLIGELSNTAQTYRGDYRFVTQTVPLNPGLPGQSVRFAFVVWTDETRPTVFRIDDVSLKWEN